MFHLFKPEEAMKIWEILSKEQEEEENEPQPKHKAIDAPPVENPKVHSKIYTTIRCIGSSKQQYPTITRCTRAVQTTKKFKFEYGTRF